jgi:hypothetical protein
MPLIYGEGPMVFKRLQLEIMKSSTDLSLFAWKAKRFILTDDIRGPLANDVDEFAGCGNVRQRGDAPKVAFEMTNLGLRITLPVRDKFLEFGRKVIFAYLGCEEDGEDPGSKHYIGICNAETIKFTQISQLTSQSGQHYRVHPEVIYEEDVHRHNKLAGMTAAPSLLSIIEPPTRQESLSRPLSDKKEKLCEFEYTTLDGDYLLDSRSIPSESIPKINFVEPLKVRVTIHQGHFHPWVLVFSHKEKEDWFWVGLTLVDGELRPSIGTNPTIVDPQTPYMILMDTSSFLGKKDFHGDYSAIPDMIMKTLPSSRVVKLVVRKGKILDRIGYIVRIKSSLSWQGSVWLLWYPGQEILALTVL